MTATVQHRWLAALTTIVAAQYAVVGLGLQAGGRAAGLLGAAAILASLAIAGRSRRAAVTLIVLGALPLAVLTWWSIATPVLAIVCLTLGWPRRSLAPCAPLPSHSTDVLATTDTVGLVPMGSTRFRGNRRGTDRIVRRSSRM